MHLRGHLNRLPAITTSGALDVDCFRDVFIKAIASRDDFTEDASTHRNLHATVASKLCRADA
jgi:hypothetical protein